MKSTRQTNKGSAEAARTFKMAQACFVASTGSQNWKKGFELLKRAAALDHAVAHEWLGAAYDYGLGTRRSRRRSFDHYLTAAKAGSPNAEYHIGIFYLDRIVGRKDYPRGLKWIKKAAGHGDATAVHVLGECHRYGQGVPKNPKKGFALELKAARKGVPEAQFAVGLCLSLGRGVRVDPEEALKWYRKAATKGIEDAAYNVGYFYEIGRGTRRNPKRARYWFSRAKELREEHKGAQDCLPPRR